MTSHQQESILKSIERLVDTVCSVHPDQISKNQEDANMVSISSPPCSSVLDIIIGLNTHIDLTTTYRTWV